MRHPGQGGRRSQKNSHGRKQQNARTHLCHELHEAVTSAQDENHAEDADYEGEDISLDIDTEVVQRKEVGDRRSRCEASRLAESGLQNRRDEHVPNRPLVPRRGISVEHAAACGVRKAKRHLETVILEDIGDRDYPQERKLEPAARDRRGNEMTGTDAGHHQDQSGAELPGETDRGHLGKGKRF